MDKIERVTRAFKGEEVDHIPVCLWKHIPPTLWKDELFIKAQMDFYKETDVDFIKLSADKYFCWPAPVLKDIQSAKQLYDIKPLGAHHPHIRGQINRTKKIMEEINGECLAFYLIFCPLSYLRLEIGYPKMMQFMEEDPEAVLYAENVIAQDVKVLVKGIIEEAKVAGIFYSVQNAEENRFTYETYRKYITPPEKEVLDYANTLSDMNVLHCCGWEGIPNRLEDWADYKTAVVSWARYIEGLDVKEAKEKFGRTVWGGFDNRPGSLIYTGTKEELMHRAIELSKNSVKTGGGPFGAVIAKDGIIIAEASNSVTIDLDPTAHAEVNCIRQATRKLKTFNLEGCEIYTSCEPCPMCLGAIYWAHLDRIYYANDRKDAAKVGFDDEFIYEEIDRKIEDRHKPMIALMRDEALGAFRMWEENAEKTEY